MKHLKFISFFVFFFIFSSIKSAPTGEIKNLYEKFSEDPRFVKLYKQKFVQECKTDKPICLALIDLTLRFDEIKIDFGSIEVEVDNDFCGTKLLKILPDAPTMSETSALAKSYNLTWIKDIFKLNDGKMCNEQCTYESFEDYNRKVKPVCVFIYDQYKLLTTKNGSEMKTEKIVLTSTQTQQEHEESMKPKATQPLSVQSPSPVQSQIQPKPNVISEVGTLVDVVEAKKIESTAIITVNKTEQVSKEEEPKKVSNETKKVDEKPLVTSPAAQTQTSDKVDQTAQLKSDTKTTNVNLEDEQLGLNDNQIFDQTQGPENEDNTNLDNIEGGINPDDDDDDMYSVDFPLRDNNLNGNKFPQEQLTDIEPHESDNPQRVQSAPFEEDPDSNFFTYLCIIMFLTIVLYILYHNKQKILALLLEGRQGRNSRRPRSRGGSKAAYSKLDCNLEEAITSKKSLSGKSMDIIY